MLKMPEAQLGLAGAEAVDFERHRQFGSGADAPAPKFTAGAGQSPSGETGHTRAQSYAETRGEAARIEQLERLVFAAGCVS